VRVPAHSTEEPVTLAIDMSSLLPQFPVQLTTVKQFAAG
jgi:hypothetical protein